MQNRRLSINLIPRCSKFPRQGCHWPIRCRLRCLPPPSLSYSTGIKNNPDPVTTLQIVVPVFKHPVSASNKILCMSQCKSDIFLRFMKSLRICSLELVILRTHSFTQTVPNVSVIKTIVFWQHFIMIGQPQKR